MSKPLARQEQRLFDMLSDPPGVDVPILQLFEGMGSKFKATSNKDRQMAVGGRLSSMMSKLDGWKLRPGDLKQTYRLERIDGKPG